MKKPTPAFTQTTPAKHVYKILVLRAHTLIIADECASVSEIQNLHKTIALENMSIKFSKPYP